MKPSEMIKYIYDEARSYTPEEAEMLWKGVNLRCKHLMFFSTPTGENVFYKIWKRSIRKHYTSFLLLFGRKK